MSADVVGGGNDRRHQKWAGGPDTACVGKRGTDLPGEQVGEDRVRIRPSTVDGGSLTPARRAISARVVRRNPKSSRQERAASRILSSMLSLGRSESGDSGCCGEIASPNVSLRTGVMCNTVTHD